jgi:ArsR family transcriptional regulator
MRSSLPALLKVLADPTRLRILGLLAREELSVGELARAVSMLQSRVSNHLKVLRECGLLEERREGASVLVRLARGNGQPDDLWSAVEARLASVEGHENDLRRLAQVLEARRQKSREFFDRVAPEWDKVGSEFKRGLARWRAISSLIPRGLVVADVGCGTGYMARALVRVAERVICIDHSSAMLEQAKARLAGRLDRVEFREGELDRLPLVDGEVDAVFASLVLHHVPDMLAALREARRALKEGGRLVVTDLLPHRESWMSEAMADLRLGLDPTELRSKVERAGFGEAEVDVIDDVYVVEGPQGQRAELPLFLIHACAVQAAPAEAPRARSVASGRSVSPSPLATAPRGEIST